MNEEIFFIVVGYLSGSVLFVHLAARLLEKKFFWKESKDKNPGTANAFQYGGFLCGIFTLFGDVWKGFLPVNLYIKSGGDFISEPVLSAVILAAPVLGHAFPIFFKFQGGKGIAVTFGCLLGMLPSEDPVITLAMMFLLFSLVLRITPHFYRTIATYLATVLCLIGLQCEPGVIMGFILITATVCLRLHMSGEEREKVRVKLL